MSNKANNTEEIKNQETEQTQEQTPVTTEPKAAENQQPAEQNTEKEFKKVLFWEVRKAPKKEKESKEKDKKSKDGKWGFGKAVSVATIGVTAISGAVKITTMILDKVYGNGDSNYQYENEVPSYQQQAVEGQYQDVPASETNE